MGEITSSFTPTPQRFPFQVAGGAILDYTAQPRAEIFFQVANGVVTSGEVGDSQGITISLVLPANFVYGLAEVFVSLQAVTTNSDLDDWQDNCHLVLIDGTSTTMTAFMPLHCDGPAGPFKHYFPRSTMDRLVSSIGSGSSQTFQLFNPVLDGAAMEIEAMFRFWQYDVEQRHNVSVQTPTLVKGAN